MFPPDLPRRIDEEWGPVSSFPPYSADTSRLSPRTKRTRLVFPPVLSDTSLFLESQGSHVEILGTAFPGRDGDISTPKDNLIEALDQRRGALVVPLSVSMNCQDYVGATLIPWPTAQDPLTRSDRPEPHAAPPTGRLASHAAASLSAR